MNWVWYILIANGGIFCLEYIYRKGTFGTFLEALPYIFIPMLIAQYGLYYGFRTGGAKSLFLAGVVFTLINWLLRCFNSHFLIGEKITAYQLVAIGLVLVATVIFKLK